MFHCHRYTALFSFTKEVQIVPFAYVQLCYCSEKPWGWHYSLTGTAIIYPPEKVHTMSLALPSLPKLLLSQVQHVTFFFFCFATCQVAKLKTVCPGKKWQEDQAAVVSLHPQHTCCTEVTVSCLGHAQPSQLQNKKFLLLSMCCSNLALEVEQSQTSPLFSCFNPNAWTLHPSAPSYPNSTWLDSSLSWQLAGFTLHYLLPWETPKDLHWKTLSK